MESLYLLIPIALVFLAIAIKVLFWAVKSGQYEDLDTEAHRILFDDAGPVTPSQQARPEEVRSSEVQPRDDKRADPEAAAARGTEN